MNKHRGVRTDLAVRVGMLPDAACLAALGS